MLAEFFPFAGHSSTVAFSYVVLTYLPGYGDW